MRSRVRVRVGASSVSDRVMVRNNAKVRFRVRINARVRVRARVSVRAGVRARARVKTRPRGYKTFFKLSSAGHEISTAHKC